MQRFGLTINKYSLTAEALPTLYLPDPKDGVVRGSPAAMAVTANESVKKRVRRVSFKTTATQAKAQLHSVGTQVHLRLQMPAYANTQTELVSTMEAAVQT
ncbi:hypothetical protein MTO96_007240 [Rhipicephalus appendiculatus]